MIVPFIFPTIRVVAALEEGADVFKRSGFDALAGYEIQRSSLSDKKPNLVWSSAFQRFVQFCLAKRATSDRRPVSDEKLEDLEIGIYGGPRENRSSIKIVAGRVISKTDEMLDHFKCVETTGIGQRLLVVEIGHVGICSMLDKKVKNSDIWILGRFVNAEVVFGRSIAPCFLPMW